MALTAPALQHATHSLTAPTPAVVGVEALHVDAADAASSAQTQLLRADGPSCSPLTAPAASVPALVQGHALWVLFSAAAALDLLVLGLLVFECLWTAVDVPEEELTAELEERRTRSAVGEGREDGVLQVRVPVQIIELILSTLAAPIPMIATVAFTFTATPTAIRCSM